MLWGWYCWQWAGFLWIILLVFGVPLAGWLAQRRAQRRAALSALPAPARPGGPACRQTGQAGDRQAELAHLAALDWSRGPLAVANREQFWVRFPYGEGPACRQAGRYVYVKAQVGADHLPPPSPSRWVVSIILVRWKLGRPVYAPRLRLLPGRGAGRLHLVYTDGNDEIALERKVQRCSHSKVTGLRQFGFGARA